MANPNRAAAEHRRRVGRDPKAVAAVAERMSKDEMVQDMGKFQRGEMSAEKFMAKWQPKE
ncbi:hypothetical protein [Mesorhizobium sp. NZP2298]|uniref:hypothetical protein n=1 Tax=Mesorhizobium sp. NZP2298 TaxID=2483403 RepID=UPI0015516C55|nr:hypothetical protein [Mesorhizobium sp. NZP2298]QKC99143.1 hypothetical protein EB231_34695 [Mesorhizobium sp. NZP2298]